MRQIDLEDWLTEQQAAEHVDHSDIPEEKASSETYTPAFSGEAVRFQKPSLLRSIQKLLDPGQGLRKPAICLCGFPRSSEVDVHLAEQYDNRAGVMGIFRCGNGNVCPFCAPRISALRAERYRKVDAATQALGGRILCLTFTLQHHADVGLGELLAAQKKASTGARSGGTWNRKIRALLKAAGVLVDTHIRRSIRGGWHPHQHLTIACLTNDEAEILKAATELVRRYIALLAKLGFHAEFSQQHINLLAARTKDNRKGYDYPANHHRPAITGDLIEEMDDDTSLSPFEIAELAAKGDAEATAWLQEYAQSVHSMKSAIITAPMAKALNIEASADPDPYFDETTRLGSIPQAAWRRLLDNGDEKLFLTRVRSAGRRNWPVVRWWALEVTGCCPRIDKELARQYVELEMAAQQLTQDTPSQKIAENYLAGLIDRHSEKYGKRLVKDTLDYVKACRRNIDVKQSIIESWIDNFETWAGKLALRKRYQKMAREKPRAPSFELPPLAPY